ncbi:MAG: hypothetical protein AUG51_14435 [Acidobacteria bacterium 13_1_20CM_3_53_8]|nr:MAG: hypothetical protein AUG51_14435 [Acidobacteria bacterium 13_1_20CM_3_53_8]
MSNWYERNQERDAAGRSSNGVIWLFGQMMMLPLTVFVYGMELFVKTIQGRQSVPDDGMDVIAGRTTLLPYETPHNRNESTSSRSTCVTDGSAKEDAAQTIPKETNNMNDRDLSDNDMLKLVRYKVLFIKRDYEVAFPEVEELVSDDLTDTAYTAWKVAEFIQSLDETAVPKKKWEGGTDGGKKPKYPKYAQYTGGKWVIHKLDEEDKKYIRVYYEVLDRYPREKFKHDERQIEVLEEIRDRIKV